MRHDRLKSYNFNNSTTHSEAMNTKLSVRCQVRTDYEMVIRVQLESWSIHHEKIWISSEYTIKVKKKNLCPFLHKGHVQKKQIQPADYEIMSQNTKETENPKMRLWETVLNTSPTHKWHSRNMTNDEMREREREREDMRRRTIQTEE